MLPAGSSRAYRPGTTLPPALSQGTFQNAGCRRRPSGIGGKAPFLARPGAVGSLISPCNYPLPARAFREQLIFESFSWGPARLFSPRAPRAIFCFFVFGPVPSSKLHYFLLCRCSRERRRRFGHAHRHTRARARTDTDRYAHQHTHTHARARMETRARICTRIFSARAHHSRFTRAHVGADTDRYKFV